MSMDGAAERGRIPDHPDLGVRQRAEPVIDQDPATRVDGQARLPRDLVHRVSVTGV